MEIRVSATALKTVAIWSIPRLSLVCCGVTLAAGMGYRVKVERIIPVLVGVLFIIIG